MTRPHDPLWPLKYEAAKEDLPRLLGVRPNWDQYFLTIARDVSLRATCNRAKVGVVVVDDENFILITGYNGALPGEPHCPPDESLEPDKHCFRSMHAEDNVLTHAARRGTRLQGATWYLWPFGPCPRHEREIRATKPARLVYPKEYPHGSQG